MCIKIHVTIRYMYHGHSRSIQLMYCCIVAPLITILKKKYISVYGSVSLLLKVCGAFNSRMMVLFVLFFLCNSSYFRCSFPFFMQGIPMKILIRCSVSLLIISGTNMLPHCPEMSDILYNAEELRGCFEISGWLSPCLKGVKYHTRTNTFRCVKLFKFELDTWRYFYSFHLK